jgi:hypothetical protein
VIAIVAVTVLIPILLSFKRWRRKHHKDLELIASETPPTSQTGKPQVPRRLSVTSAVSNLIDVATTVIGASEPQTQGRPHASRIRNLRQRRKTAIENVKRPNPTLMHLEKPDSGPPASAANMVTELRMVITPALRPARQ